jgi:hypothetical protein
LYRYNRVLYTCPCYYTPCASNTTITYGQVSLACTEVIIGYCKAGGSNPRLAGNATAAACAVYVNRTTLLFTFNASAPNATVIAEDTPVFMQGNVTMWIPPGAFAEDTSIMIGELKNESEISAATPSIFAGGRKAPLVLLAPHGGAVHVESSWTMA